MERCSAHAGGLEDQADAVLAPHPRRLRPVGRAPSQRAGDDRGHVVFEPGEVLVGIEPRPGFEHQHVHAALGELFRDDRAAAAGADDDHVAHQASSR
jgi:hypothetical protein